MTKRVLLGWQISTLHGWGVYGLNLALIWASDQQIELATTMFDPSVIVDIDHTQHRALGPFVRRSQELQNVLQSHANGRMKYKGAFIAALGNDLRALPNAYNVSIAGKPTVGAVFFEQGLTPGGIDRAKEFSLIVTGSMWNERVLRAYGVKNVRTIHQGIDPTYFHPGSKRGFLQDKFLIFSGGKPEYRKAQDIVLGSFKLFLQRHPEAVLVTAWHSFWPELARSLDWSGLVSPVVFKERNQFNPSGWAIANGIAAHQIIELGVVPNLKMSSILREMDVAIFPNRAEGGTNLVAMECMACGLPVILSRNTGHIDLIDNESCYTLDDQRQTARGFAGVDGVEGWGESQIDEVVERLEQVYFNRAEARRRGTRAAERLAQFTWQATAQQMKDVVIKVA